MQEKSKEDLLSSIERVREEDVRKKTRKTRCLFCRQRESRRPTRTRPRSR